jgi:hypothetical protein
VAANLEMKVRTVATIICRWDPIIVRVTVAQATPIPTTHHQFNHRRQYSYNIKPLIRLKLSLSIRTILSIVILQFRLQQVRLCNQFTRNKTHPFNRPSIFKLQTTVLEDRAQRAPQAQPLPLLRLFHPNENDL